MEKEYSVELYNAYKDYLDSQGWKYEFNEEIGCFDFKFLADRHIYVDFYVFLHEDFYYFLSDIYIKFKKNNLNEVAEYIHRVNNKIRHSKFEMDYDEKRLSLTNVIYCAKRVPDYVTLYDTTYDIIHCTEKYIPALYDVNEGKTTAKEAIAKINCKTEEELKIHRLKEVEDTKEISCEEKSPSLELFNAYKEYLDKRNMKYEIDMENDLVLYPSECKTDRIGDFRVIAGENFLFFLIKVLIEIDMKNIHEVAEYLHRANHACHIGRTEFDYDEKSVHLFNWYKNPNKSMPTCEELDYITDGMIYWIEYYIDGLFDVNEGKITAKEAIEKINSKIDGE